MQTLFRGAIVCFFMLFFSIKNFSNAQRNDFVVVLDAGHGGHDPGNRGNGYFEKDIALSVTLEIGKSLAKIPGIKVIYTRDKDVFIPLHQRADIANKADADLFISIHCNSVNKESPYGTETWVLGANNDIRNFEFAKRENEVIFLEENYEENYAGFDPNSPESSIAIGIEQEVYIEQSILLGRKIENKFVNTAKRKSRGLKQGSLLVIRNTYMPSVLVELGFLTNKEEGAFLNNKNAQKIMAEAIRDAVIEFKDAITGTETKIVSTNKPTPTVPITKNPNPENPTPNTQLIPKNDVVFKVQIAASSNNLETKSFNFNGLNPITKVKQGSIFKYYYGNANTIKEAESLKQQARLKGYNSSFLVAFKNGKPISMSEALK